MHNAWCDEQCIIVQGFKAGCSLKHKGSEMKFISKIKCIQLKYNEGIDKLLHRVLESSLKSSVCLSCWVLCAIGVGEWVVGVIREWEAVLFSCSEYLPY